MAKPILTAARVRELLEYDEVAGVLRWKVASSNVIKIGQVAGTAGPRYVSVKIDRQKVPAHRAIFLIMVGRPPSPFIDHINGDGKDNRWSNLREASSSLNNENQRTARKDNTSGFLGVTSHRGKFFARIQVSGKAKFLGYFDEPEDAHQAYLEAKRRLHLGCTI